MVSQTEVRSASRRPPPLWPSLVLNVLNLPLEESDDFLGRLPATELGRLMEAGFKRGSVPSVPTCASVWEPGRGGTGDDCGPPSRGREGLWGIFWVAPVDLGEVGKSVCSSKERARTCMGGAVN